MKNERQAAISTCNVQEQLARSRAEAFVTVNIHHHACHCIDPTARVGEYYYSVHIPTCNRVWGWFEILADSNVPGFFDTKLHLQTGLFQGIETFQQRKTIWILEPSYCCTRIPKKSFLLSSITSLAVYSVVGSHPHTRRKHSGKELLILYGPVEADTF